MREAMRERCLLSYRPLLFERSEDGSFRPPADWQPQALAVVSTHDLPTLRGFWLGEDLELLAQLGLYPNDAAREQAVIDARAGPRPAAAGAAAPGPAAARRERAAHLGAGCHAGLRRLPCTPTSPARRRWLVGVQLEDVTGAAAAGERARHHRGPLPQLAPQARRSRSRTWPPTSASSRSPPCCAPSAAGPRPRPRPPSCPTWRPPASRWPPTACSSTRAAASPTSREAVPYLHALGISHLYSSPFLRARPGSTHGYDIVDHTALNPEVGDDARLRAHVPRPAAPRHGPDARPGAQPHGRAGGRQRLVARRAGARPGLGPRADLRHRMGAGRARDGGPRAAAGAGRPLRPGAGVRRAAAALRRPRPASSACATGTTASRSTRRPIPTSWPCCPRRRRRTRARATAMPWSRRCSPRSSACRRATAATTSSAARACATPPSTSATWRAWWRATTGCAHWIDSCVQRFNGSPGEPASFDLLDRLIGAAGLPAGRLARGQRRRQLPPLLRRQHAGRAAHGAARGVRGHARAGAALAAGRPPGRRCASTTRTACRDPQQYFERLQARYARQAEVAGREPRALYLVVEKILAEHEPLSHHWPVHGDTGYRFAQPGQRPVRRHRARGRRCSTACTAPSPASTRTSPRSRTSASG